MPLRVEEVTDRADPRVAPYAMAARPHELASAGLLLAEGRLTVQRLLQQPRFRVRSVLTTAAALPGVETAAPADASFQVLVSPRELVAGIVGFAMHRGCLALAERPAPIALASLPLSSMRRVLALDRVSNPDNIGALFRNAAAFGVDLVLLGRGCGDPLYRKAIRTSMAATLRVPFVETTELTTDLDRLRATGFTVLALTPEPTALPLRGFAGSGDRLALLLGAEHDGLHPHLLRDADTRIRIETSPAVDSLNVATAGAIALHHFSSPLTQTH